MNMYVLGAVHEEIDGVAVKYPFLVGLTLLCWVGVSEYSK